MNIIRKPRDWLVALAVGWSICLAFVATAAALTFEYKIISAEPGINTPTTTATIDTDLHEIRLPKYVPKAVSFWDEDLVDYVIMTPGGLIRYSFDGTAMQPLKIVDSTQLSNPIAAVTSSPYPDVVVVQNNDLTHYSLAGPDMVSNPVLTVQGLNNAWSVGTRGIDTAALDDNKLLYYGFDGSNMIKIPALSIESGLSNPIDFALWQDNYDSVVLDENSVKYYHDNSLATVLTGMEGSVSIAAGNNGNIAVAKSNEVRRYSLAAGSMTYSNALSVTTGLTAPTAIALHPQNNDCVIVDGNAVKYYMWDGSQMVYNPALSVTVAGLKDMGTYIPSAIAESIAYNTPDNVTRIRITATEEIPGNTAVKWYGTATNEWTPGTLNTWITVPEGNKLRWRAVLSTRDRNATPVTKAPIKIETNIRPDPPIIDIPDDGTCYLTPSPPIRWQVNDPDDPDDEQTAFQVVVYTDAAGTEELINTGKVLSSNHEYVIDSGGTNFIWLSGQDHFWVKIKTWDKADAESDFSSRREFCVDAVTNPIIKKIVLPDTTNKPITKGTVTTDLAPSRAGSLITLQFDSIGIANIAASFPYLTHTATITGAPTQVNGVGSATNKRWEVKFYTDANTTVCPQDTIINGLINGDGISNLLIMQNPLNSYGSRPAEGTAQYWQWEGYRWWSEGVARVDNSMFKNWSVVLQGRKE